jgi:hypothetical protein
VRSTHRAVTWGLGVLSGALTLTLLGSPPATAATATPPPAAWTLVDYNARICVDAEIGRQTYLIAWIEGTWHTQLEIGTEGLPAGSYSPPSPVAPGSDDGHSAQGGMLVHIPPTPPGTYPAAMYARGGNARQTVPVIIDVRTRC